jgi:hypothetical protein
MSSDQLLPPADLNLVSFTKRKHYEILPNQLAIVVHYGGREGESHLVEYSICTEEALAEEYSDFQIVTWCLLCLNNDKNSDAFATKP